MSSIKLPTGGSISTEDVVLDKDSQRFMLGVVDVTDYMTIAQMREFDGFNNAQFLDNRYRQDAIARTGKDPGAPPDYGALGIMEDTVSGSLQDFGEVARATPNYLKNLAIIAVVGMFAYALIMLAPAINTAAAAAKK